jgi:hypothetical protein
MGLDHGPGDLIARVHHPTLTTLYLYHAAGALTYLIGTYVGNGSFPNTGLCYFNTLSVHLVPGPPLHRFPYGWDVEPDNEPWEPFP